MIDTQEIYDKAQEFMSDNDPPDEVQKCLMAPLCDLCDEVDRLRKLIKAVVAIRSPGFCDCSLITKEALKGG